MHSHIRRAGTALVAALFVPVNASAQSSDRCTELKRLQIAGVDLTVSTVEWHPAGPAPAAAGPARPVTALLPSYCRFDGTIDRRVGAGGKSYGIRFALALPDAWNGRFLF